MALKSALPPSNQKLKSQFNQPSKSAQTLHALRTNFSISTWLMMGALLQGAIVFVIPRLYAFLPVLLVLSVRFGETMAISLGLKRNHYLDGAINHRVAPQVPDEDGNFADNPSNEKVVVFLLGTKSSHPLGVFAPQFSKLLDYLDRMKTVLEEESTERGFYGASNWQGYDKNGVTEYLFLSYWRRTEDIHNFAYGPYHRKGWDWWLETIDQNDHVGIHHEIFEVDRHMWEGLYVNFQPTLLGATSYLKKGDKMIGGKIEDQWISSLVDARKGKMRSSAGRLGRDPQENAEKFKFDGYVDAH